MMFDKMEWTVSKAFAFMIVSMAFALTAMVLILLRMVEFGMFISVVGFASAVVAGRNVGKNVETIKIGKVKPDGDD